MTYVTEKGVAKAKLCSFGAAKGAFELSVVKPVLLTYLHMRQQKLQPTEKY